MTDKAVKPHAAAKADPVAKTVKSDTKLTVGPTGKPVAKPAVVAVKADAAAVKTARTHKAVVSGKPATPVPAGELAAVSRKPVSHPSKKKPEEVTKTPVEPTAHAPKAAKPAAPTPVAKVAAGAAQLTPLGVPVRSGRPSSRLAQLTVPSMAQSVASTAAKSSFTQMSTVAPITPVLASAVKKDPALANNWKTKPVNELTDAEVIAMPDDVYMNDTQMAFFRMKLVDLKNGILNNAGETTEHLREDTVVVPDPADRATIEEEHALELRTRDRERKLLKKIEQSISRIDAGDYGYCDETGESIGVGRLLARPTATLSLEAQQRRELKQKMFGD